MTGRTMHLIEVPGPLNRPRVYMIEMLDGSVVSFMSFDLPASWSEARRDQFLNDALECVRQRAAMAAARN
jgi:hypothetical protein